MSLKEKNILVIGASSGIGRSIAVLCSKLGANIILVARNEDKLKQTLSMLDSGEHSVVPFDLTHIDQMESLLNICINNGQKLDGLAYSAGVGPVTPIGSTNYKKALDIFNINYFAFIELVKFYSKQKYSNGGSIVAVSSISSFVGLKGSSIYCGSKGALDSSIKALALELAPKNIRINSVAPSHIKTDMLNSVVDIMGEEHGNALEAKQPLGLGNGDDVANVVAFLLSEAARFITGTSIIADGGYLAQ